MAAPARVSARLYKDLLTPALHRRFVKAAMVTLGVCYLEAVIIGDKSSFLWSWFPLGRTGIRTLLLFISALAIFILRVAQLRVGPRNTVSPFQTFWRCLLSYNALQTSFWYLFSAWWFSEVYVWSMTDEAELAWVVAGRPNERPRLNERPIYLRCTFFMLACAQIVIHMYRDYDRIVLPASQSNGDRKSLKAALAIQPEDCLKIILPQRAQAALLPCLSLIVVGPVVYAIFLRSTAWSWALSLAKIFWSLPKSSATPPITPPFHISLIMRSITAGFLLVFLWEVTSATFSTYVALPPLKKQIPLTDESRDPNGSLLLGLKAKKEVPRSFAFWELVHISENVPSRRQTFFLDIERKGGATWTQVLNICLDVIQALNTRITDELNPRPPVPTPNPALLQGNPDPLPKIAPPLRNGDIFTSSPPPQNRQEMVQHQVGSLARSYGQSPPSSSRSPRISPRVRKLITYGVDRTLTPQQKQLFSAESRSSHLNSALYSILSSPLGFPFRESLARRSAVIVLGTYPSGHDLGYILDAIDSLTFLTIFSLEEDKYGRVQKDVATIIRSFTITVKGLETLKGNLKPHWTDVEAVSGSQKEKEDYRERSFKEVDALLKALKKGLGGLVLAFETYADDLGLGMREMREAREAADYSA